MNQEYVADNHKAYKTNVKDLVSCVPSDEVFPSRSSSVYIKLFYALGMTEIAENGFTFW